MRGLIASTGFDRNRELHMVLVAVLTAVVFSNSLANEMHLDSVHRVRDNPEIERFWPPWRHFTDARTSTSLSSIVVYRPMLPLSLSINHAASEALGIDRLAGFHIGNILIHIGTSLLLYLLFTELLEHWNGSGWPRDRRRTTAWIAASLFAIHPVSGASVNYVCGRDLLMMLFFLTASLLVYVRMRRRGQSLTGWLACLVLLALSLLSKQNSVVAPLLVFGFEIVVARSSIFSWSTWKWPAALVGAVAGYFIYTQWTMGIGPWWSGGSLTPWEYGTTMLRAHAVYYGRNLVWPFDMRALPELEPATSIADAGVALGLGLVVGSVVTAFALRRRTPIASWAIVAYWVAFAPTSSLQPFRFLVLDYRQYPSLAFACLLVAVALGSRLSLPRYRAVMTALLLYFSVSTYHSNTVWRTEESFWRQSVEHGTLPMGHLAYARAIQHRDPGLAETHYAEALRVEPGNVYALVNLAFLRIQQQRPDEAVALARSAVALKPDWGFTHFWLAETYRTLGRFDEATTSSRRAADLDPLNVEYQYAAALDQQRSHRYNTSLEYLARATKRAPDYRRSGFFEAYALEQLGRVDDARRAYDSFLRTHPDDDDASARYRALTEPP